MLKQRKSHVYNVETMLKLLVLFLEAVTVFPKIISLYTKNSDVGSFPFCCSSMLLGTAQVNNRGPGSTMKFFLWFQL